ncbi:STAS domain-containing protein [Streptomyces sp. NPDC005202]|uniref:STAS domain-containing protein n=1 Tax=Streptomyces sp. NPDC005202 TaxID=3157021 RepID=UPI0033B2B72F
MTASQPSPFGLTAESGPSSVVVRIAGDLDYATHGELVETVTSLLARRHAARHPMAELHLDFSRLDSVDSSGLSALLLIRRRTDEAGVGLHRDARPAVLERLLDMTETLEWLTAPAHDAAEQRRPGTG